MNLAIIPIPSSSKLYCTKILNLSTNNKAVIEEIPPIHKHEYVFSFLGKLEHTTVMNCPSCDKLIKMSDSCYNCICGDIICDYCYENKDSKKHMHKMKYIRNLYQPDVDRNCNKCSKQIGKNYHYYCATCNYTECISCTPHTHEFRFSSVFLSYKCYICQAESKASAAFTCCTCGINMCLSCSPHTHDIYLTHHSKLGASYAGGYICDICRNINEGDVWHCFTCKNYDECSSCRKYKIDLAFDFS